MLEKLVEIAAGASDLIMEVYSSSDFGEREKADRSPVTEADLRSHEHIHAELTRNFDYPVLSEEGAVTDEERLSWSTFWLVDPLDGTRNFLAKDGEFTINIALIKDGVPIAGLVYTPAFREAYFGEKGGGAFKIKGDAWKRLQNTRMNTCNLIGAFSKFHDSPESDEFCSKYGITEKRSYGSALKLCMLAAGQIDVYPRLAPTMEWDIAAGHCIAIEAGCKVIDCETGEELRYNKPSLRNNNFIASRSDLDFLAG